MVTAELNGTSISVNALAEGTAVLTVTDNQTQQSQTLNVTVQDNNVDYNAKVFVQGGTFLMGSPDGVGYGNEHPQHQVTLGDFYMGKYEVTNAQYAEFLNIQGNQTEGGETWLNVGHSGCGIEQWVGGRLPTEAEWEYAARGGNQSQGYTYAGSNNLDYVAWHSGNSYDAVNPIYEGRGTHIVGTKQANELGIHDMSGNVWEWCQDKWHDDYYGAPADGSAWENGNSSSRVLRGGRWYSDANRCRVAYRSGSNPNSDYFYGFRVVFD